MNCVKHDPKEGDYYNDKNNMLIQKACEILYEIDGVNYMKDILLAYVPRRYRRHIEYA